MIVVPYSTIEPIKQKLSSSFQTDNDMADSIWTNSIQNHILETKASLVVKLGETEMTVGDLLTLRERRHYSHSIKKRAEKCRSKSKELKS
jgi:flagellar motor switch protein FliM